MTDHQIKRLEGDPHLVPYTAQRNDGGDPYLLPRSGGKATGSSWIVPDDEPYICECGERFEDEEAAARHLLETEAPTSEVPTGDDREAIAEYSRECAEEFMEEYRDTHGDPVAELSSMTVFADRYGHELTEWASELGISRQAVAMWHHDQAKNVDYSWAAADPVVLLHD